ncbi:hypothetical protein [Nocardia alni]|uniref:hypothetical protein n=1 Tax=Nocardia alni TaxID=2815723 RepID=UPI001C23E188|nr:hypothetical protein [Nocardia alni]
MIETPYPNLGFNPVPGTPDDVAGLRGQVNSAGEAVKETNGLLNRLRNANDDIWKGAGGDAFRAHFDATLAQDLGYAQSSLERAVSVLDEWHTDLVGYQSTAKGLESEAAEARGKHAQAETAFQQAKSNPDLGLADQTFTDEAQLAAAQSRLNAAEAKVRSAGTEVENWQGQLESILKRAHDLESEHAQKALKVAAELDAAAKDFAPSPPHHHWWDKITDALKAVGDWISKHRKLLHNILSTVSAIGGLVALLTPPPFDAIGMAVGAVASLANVGLDVSDPKVRHDIGDFAKGVWNGDFMHGDFHTKDLGSIATLAGDSLGGIPALGTVKGIASMGKLGEEAAEAGKAAPALKDVLSDVAKSPGWAVKKLEKLPIPDSVFGVGAHANPELRLMNRLDGIDLAWRGKSVVSDGYHDIKDWINS